MSGVQLRLGFDEPTAPVTLFLRATGVRVVADVRHGTANDAHAYLTAAGLEPELSTATGLAFPLSRFKELSHISERCTVIADATLRPLLEWVERQPDDGLAAELDLGPDGTLWLTWVCSGTPISEPLTAASATAVLVSDVPFVAAPEPLAVMRTMCPLPVLVGRLRTHRSGYVEVETAKPQMLEMFNLPGMFRIDDTTYGLPFAALPFLAHLDGFIWEGPPPQLESGPRHLPPMPAKLSAHVTEDLRRLVDSLAAYRTQVVVWEAGLGRRVFVLAALVALDAFPALVVARPERVWQWWRHAALFSRTRGVDVEDADVRVVTYAEFASNPSVAYGAQTLIFDDVTSPDADTPEVAAAAIGVGGMLDCYLVGIADHLPADPKQLAGVMSRLRPAEFSSSHALLDRYGTDVATRLRNHASAYLSRRTAADPGADRALHTFNHTQVEAVSINDELRRDLDTIAERYAGAPDLITRLREMVSSGSQYCLSPKVAIAVAMAEESMDAGRRVALVTDFGRTATMLAGLLRTHHPEHVRTPVEMVPKARLVIVEGMSALPDMSWFDDVVVLDYPSTYAVLDTAVGHPDSQYAPNVVTLLHAVSTVDDQLAIAAARAEEAQVQNASATWTAPLSPRALNPGAEPQDGFDADEADDEDLFAGLFDPEPDRH